MLNEMINEWNLILKEKIMIYGAGYSAGYLYDLIEDLGKRDTVLGFVVTDSSNNPKEYKDHKVFQIDSLNDRSVSILVPSTGTSENEIRRELEKRSFTNPHYVSRLIMMSQFENNEFITEERARYMQSKSVKLDKDKEIRDTICEILSAGQPRFGGLEPYQSLECIGLIGKRPTSYRIEKYGLMDVLRKDMNVLDIGCNTSFIDFSIANSVNSVLGIEHEAVYVEISKKVKEYLGVSNVEVWQGEFTDWVGDNQKAYDLILSFAVHRWMGFSPKEYIEIIDKLLTCDGYVCIESHVGKIDIEYEECVNEIRSLGYRIERMDEINDSRDGKRSFIVAHKVKRK